MSDDVTLYLGDCLEVMKSLPDGSVDAVVTDPPFFTPAVHYQSRISWGRCWADMSILGQFFFDLANEFRRILKPEGNLFVFCHDESYPVFYPVAFGLWDNTGALIWDKKRIGLGKIFRHRFEMILWAYNGGSFISNNGRIHSDILEYEAILTRYREHPIEKPPAMMAELISICVPDGGIVFDGFMGSGNTGVACVNTGRKFIGSELDPKYYAIAERRIAEAQMQLRMPV